MNTRNRVVALAASVLLALGIVAVTALPASAHTHTDGATCQSVTIDLDYYDAAATVVASLDGTDLGAAFTNGAYHYSQALTFDASHTSHTLVVTVVSGDAGYSFAHTDTTPADCYVAPPVDVCANIDGPQATVPDGLVADGDNCVTPTPPSYPKPVVCASTVTLPLVNASNPAGWGDLLNGSFTDNGVQLTATSAQEAYAYVDFAGVPFTQMGDLSTVEDTQSGTWGVILQDSDGKSIHYDADGRYWSVHAGLFPETSPGFYSTYHPEKDGELLSDPTITEVAVWVNPGGSILLHSQAYNCKVQPFAATPAVVTPPVDLPSTPALAETGFDSVPYWVAVLLLLTSGFGALALKRVLSRHEA